MIREKLFVVLAFLFSISSAVQCDAQNLGAHPTTLEFTLPQGQSESQLVHLSNGSDKKVAFRLYLNDWERDSVGGHVYNDANTMARSCSRWITLDKNFVELEPGTTQAVTVKLQLPDSASAAAQMKWSMLFVETVEEQTAGQSKQAQAAVRNLLRIGIHIYQTPPTVIKKEIKVYELKQVTDKPNQYQLLCKNTGEVMLHCKSYMKLTFVKDGKETKLEPIEFPVFPDQRRFVTFELPANLEKGKYSALAVVDAGEDLSLEAVESQIEVK